MGAPRQSNGEANVSCGAPRNEDQRTEGMKLRRGMEKGKYHTKH
jgi:hypothetical protein